MKLLAHSITIGGLFLAFLPFSGLPQSWQYALGIVIGVYIAIASLFLTYRRVILQKLAVLQQRAQEELKAANTSADTHEQKQQHEAMLVASDEVADSLQQTVHDEQSSVAETKHNAAS